MRARELPSPGPPEEISGPPTDAAEQIRVRRNAPTRPGASSTRTAATRTRRARPPRESTGRAPSSSAATAAETGPLILGRYRLKRRLGAGAFGSVWQAHDEHLHREVAVKLLPRERISGGRFEREARAAARLAHPGIVTLYEAAVDDEGAYLVSELVRGPTLDRLLAAGELSDRGIVRIGIALCDALAHAHAEGVVHRDVKPSNILVPRRASTPAGLAKLTDFGVARLIGGNPLTRTGDVVGTAAYMAPEQAEGRPAEAAADLYSLALVLYEALTGVNPIADAPRTRRLGTYLPPLRRQRRDLPRALGQAIDTALRPRARERGTIEELRRALEACVTAVEDHAGTVAAPRLWRREKDDEPAEAPRVSAATAAGEDSAEDTAPPPPWAARALAAATAAGFALYVTTRVFAHQPLTPAASALTAALLVAILPRLGWLTVSIATIAGLALQHRPGAALILLIALVPTMILLARRPGVWPLSVLAPALGVVGLAGAWPALAARARTPVQRAVLAAAGYVAIALGSALAHKSLYIKSTVPPPSQWIHSGPATVSDVLKPLLSAGTIGAAVVWAVAAALLPLLRALLRARRGSAAGLLALVAWASLTALATTIAAPAILPGMAVLGAVACVVFTLAPDVTNRLRRPTRDDEFRSMEPR
jgi:serine/threonine protein kinase